MYGKNMTVSGLNSARLGGWFATLIRGGSDPIVFLLSPHRRSC
jgi:hypothetical protein